MTDARAHAVLAGRHPFNGKTSGSVSQRNEAQSSNYAPLAYEDTSGLPLHLTYLKPEAARSLFPRLIDCNQKRSTRHFPRKPWLQCSNLAAPSMGHLTLGAGRPAQNARSKTAHLAFTCLRLRSLVAALACIGTRLRTGRAPYQAPRRPPGSGRENVVVEMVTPIALVNNLFGHLSSLQRPFGDAAANVE